MSKLKATHLDRWIYCLIKVTVLRLVLILPIHLSFNFTEATSSSVWGRLGCRIALTYWTHSTWSVDAKCYNQDTAQK